MALITKHYFIESIVGRRMSDNAFTGLSPQANELCHHIDHGRTINGCIGVYSAVKTLSVPVTQCAEEIFVLPAAVAEYAVRNAFFPLYKNCTFLLRRAGWPSGAFFHRYHNARGHTDGLVVLF